MDISSINFKADELRLAKKLIQRVPESGDTIGNTRLWRDSLKCDKDLYFHVRNKLIDHGILARGGGKGGSVRLAHVQSDPSPVPQKFDPREAAIYPEIESTLREGWAPDQTYQRVKVAVSADHGKRGGGRWEHPDLVLIGFKALPYVFGNQLDLYTFEVKRTYAAIPDVYEAYAHRRFAHYAYLLVCEPSDRIDIAGLISTAKETGVGLILAPTAGEYSEWQEEVAPRRYEPSRERLNAFIGQRVPADIRNEWKAWLNISPTADIPW